MFMTSSEIRQAFLNYFTKKGHTHVPSSALVPENDPTLLFTNAGMVQFKNTFLGLEPRAYNRAVSIQRCVRAGGKHNDLENVGFTARHHTFFEMLGNFSFGDYFKREAIAFAWEFLTVELKLPVERLWVTVYQDDEESADIWLKEIGVSAARFSRCGEKDNFWSMGDTGPCGPCTEIFYDHGPHIAGGPPGSATADGDRYIEIWNLVFMQYNRDAAGVLHLLPKPSVDTGMGLERIAAVIQNVHNNYHIDTFQQLIQAIAEKAHISDLEHPSLKIIADHIRACAFLITDGVSPSNEGRGYVLRRIIRRAVRHGHKIGMVSPFFYQILKPLIQVLGDTYPELALHQDNIERTLQEEENQFSKTLEQGLTLLKEQLQGLTQKQIPGAIVFKLYDTYGFPVDLTADIAREHNLEVDMAGFEECMQRQRAQSQAASAFQINYADSSFVTPASTFHGYSMNHVFTEIIMLLDQDKTVEIIKAGQKAGIILKNTPFYAESGGQVGDRGQIIHKSCLFRVDDTQRLGDAIVHYGEMVAGEFKLNQSVDASIDTGRRDAIRLNHTATHLLHAALKQIVGPQVQQKGSLVDAERARFDFSCNEGLTQSQLQKLEDLVNTHIRANQEVITQTMRMDEAKQSGAVALFGEKYSEVVRVLSLGDFSKELCGGTHAKRTGDLGLFKITAEYGVARGIRRIEMVTGAYALQYIHQHFEVLQTVAETLKAPPLQISEKLAQLLQESKQQERVLTQFKQKLASQSGRDLLKEVKKLGEINVLVKQLEHTDSQALRTLLDELKSSMNHAIIVLFVVDHDKLNVVAGVSADIVGKVPPATTFVRHLCGKGGGREDMAQGGGPVPDNLTEKVAEIYGIIK